MTVRLQTNDNGEVFVIIPGTILEHVGWKAGEIFELLSIERVAALADGTEQHVESQLHLRPVRM